MAAGGFYAVKVGHQPGIYRTWDEAKSQVDGYSGAVFKKFPSEAEAAAFVGIEPALRGHRSRNPVANMHTRGVQKRLGSPAQYEHRTQVRSRRPDTDRQQVYAGLDTSATDGLPAIEVYTDGACQHNGRRAARAGYGVYWGPDDPRNVSAPLPGKATNNRAELTAIMRALADSDPDAPLRVLTDSKYCIMSCTRWLAGWRQAGWVTSAGTPVLNKDLIQAIDEAITSRRAPTYWHYVPGHRGIHGNVEADRLANEGVRTYDALAHK